MADTWAFDLENTIFTILKTKGKAEFVSDFPNIRFTTNNQSMDDAVFPTVYMHELAGTEYTDLEGTAINAVMETIQVDVMTNTSQTDAKAVMAAVVDIFKQMRFQITAMPEIGSGTDTTYRTTARFRRVIGANDTL